MTTLTKPPHGRYFKGEMTVETLRPWWDLSGTCWVWKGALTSNNRMRAELPRSTSWTKSAARWMWDELRPEEESCKLWSLTRKCPDARCVNPDHYFRSFYNGFMTGRGKYLAAQAAQAAQKSEEPSDPSLTVPAA